MIPVKRHEISRDKQARILKIIRGFARNIDEVDVIYQGRNPDSGKKEHWMYYFLTPGFNNLKFQSRVYGLCFQIWHETGIDCDLDVLPVSNYASDMYSCLGRKVYHKKGKHPLLV